MVQIVPVIQPGILFIAGETVMLEEPDSIESEILLDSDVAVPFDPYYLPTGMTDEERTILEDTVQLLFSNLPKDKIPTAKVQEATEVEVVSEAFPPCGKLERDLVLKSLLYRRTILRDQLSKEGVESAEDLRKALAEASTVSYSEQLKKEQVKQKEVLGVKVNAWHYLKLTNLIKSFEKNEFCIDMGDLAYQDHDLDLSDEQLERLVKQFVFFVLQTKKPLKVWVNDASGAVPVLRTLGHNPLGQERFTEFIKQYKETPGTSIPAIIAKILDDSSLDKETMKKEIDKAIEEAKRQCLEDFKSLIQDPEFIRANPNASVSEVASKLMTDLTEMQTKLRACEADKTTLQTKKQECDTELTALKEKLQRTEDQVKSLDLISKDVPGLQAAVQEGKDEVARLKAEKKTLQDEKDKITGDLAARDATIKDLQAQLATNVTRMEELNTRIIGLEEEKARTLAEHQAALDTLRRDLEAARAAALADQAAVHETALGLLRDEKERADAAKDIAESSLEAIAAEAERAAIQLADIRTALSNTEATVAENATRIAQLEKDITTKEAERVAVQESLNAATVRIGELEPELAKTKELSAAADAKVQALTSQVAGLTSENTTLKADLDAAREELAAAQAAAKACEAQLAALTTTASASETTLSELSGKVAALTVEKQNAEVAAAASAEEKKRLEGLVNTLTAEKEKAEGERNVAHSELAEKTKRLAGEETAKVSALKQVESLEGKVQGLEGEKKVLTSQTASQGRSLEEATRQKTTMQSNFDKAFGQVKSLAEWISDPKGRDETDPNEIVDVEDIDKLATLNKLREGMISMKESKHFLPIGEISKTFDTKTYKCIAVYFTTYTWLIHMPYTINDTSGEDQKTSNLLRSIFSLVLNGGTYLERTATQTPIGVYVDLSQRHAEFPDMKDKTAFAIKHMLDLMIKLNQSCNEYFQALEKNRLDEVKDKEILSPEEKKMMQVLSDHFKSILKGFKLNNFREVVQKYFVGKSPKVNEKMLTIVYSFASNTVLTTDAPEELFSYPVIWYLFLFVLRDSLNITSGSSTELCPLPPLMDKKRNPDQVATQ